MRKRSTPHAQEGKPPQAAVPVEPPPVSLASEAPESPVTPATSAEAGVASGAVSDEEVAAYLADPELSGMFVTDAVDHLGTIEAVLLKLEAAPDDTKLLNDLFRPFHTVKGNAGVLGFTSIQDLAHKVETLLDLARSGQHVLGAPEIDVVLRAVDLLLLMTQNLPARAAGQPATNVADRRASLMDVIDALIAGQARSGSPAAAPVSVEAPAALDLSRADETATSPARSGEGHSTVKVSTQKLDSLVDLVGELVIAQSILAEAIMLRSADDRLNRQLAHVKRIASELQRHTMSMRMVPIRQTFQKMARHVRDLSRKSGKPIDLVLKGEETELDRKVVEHITDPLMHMIRNTVDHGIEAAEARAAAGKPASSRLCLSALHQAGYIVIEIEDDGAGLDTERIFKKAVALGLVAEGDALAPADIHQLIFRPGFSTKDEVTAISGRGVGMDVVRRNVEALRGAIDVRTVKGQGATFTLRLPLTLATVDGLVLSVGGERFVIPTFAVRESLRPTVEQVHTVGGGACLIQIRDRLIPILHLGETFNIANAWPSVADATIVVLEDGGRQLAVVVDSLLGKQEVVIKGLGDMFRGVRGIAGGAILGDGRIGLILDAGGLMGLIDRTVLGTAA